MIKIPVTEWFPQLNLCMEIIPELESKLSAYRRAGYQVIEETTQPTNVEHSWMKISRHCVVFHDHEEDKAALFKLTYL